MTVFLARTFVCLTSTQVMFTRGQGAGGRVGRGPGTQASDEDRIISVARSDTKQLILQKISDPLKILLLLLYLFSVCCLK